MQLTFENTVLDVRENKEHEWILETSLVAEGYGVTPDAIRYHKSSNADDFSKNKHFISVRIPHSSGSKYQTFWTKRGVIRLGFFIKSERAKRFRDWAEDLIIGASEKPRELTRLEILQIATAAEESRILAEERLGEAQILLADANSYIQATESKVIFAEAVSNTNSEILVRDLAKLFGQNGISIGQNRLYEWLVNMKYLERRERWSASRNKPQYSYWPTQRAIELGVFKINSVVINPANGDSFKTTTVHVTGKGETYFIGKYLSQMPRK